MAELSDQEMLRYNRQIILRGFDFDGQEALKDSRVLVVGLGGPGCAASQYLASAGVGNLTLLDFDTVSLSNLQRQTLHSDATVGQPKVESARDALARINPHIAITPVNALLDDAELAALIAEHDLVLDCTDNVAVRNQLNAGCFASEGAAGFRRGNSYGRSNHGLHLSGRRALLSLPQPFVWRERVNLRRSRRDGTVDRRNWFVAGNGSDQTAGRLWQTGQRENRHVRCDDLSVSRNETDAQSGV